MVFYYHIYTSKVWVIGMLVGHVLSDQVPKY